MDPEKLTNETVMEHSYGFLKTFLLYPFEVAMRRAILSPTGSIHCDLNSASDIWNNLYGGLCVE